MAKAKDKGEETAEAPNPVAGMHPAELKKAIESAKTVDELHKLNYGCARNGMDENGTTRQRIAARVAELSPSKE